MGGKTAGIRLEDSLSQFKTAACCEMEERVVRYGGAFADSITVFSRVCVD